jgi:hypothetical protein
LKLHRGAVRYRLRTRQPEENLMPVLLLPVLIATPIVVGGTYLVYLFVK